MLDSPCSAGSNVLCVEVKSSVLGGAGWRGVEPVYCPLLHLFRLLTFAQFYSFVYSTTTTFSLHMYTILCTMFCVPSITFYYVQYSLIPFTCLVFRMLPSVTPIPSTNHCTILLFCVYYCNYVLLAHVYYFVYYVLYTDFYILLAPLAVLL